jgi:flagellar FliL protein
MMRRVRAPLFSRWDDSMATSTAAKLQAVAPEGTTAPPTRSTSRMKVVALLAVVAALLSGAGVWFTSESGKAWIVQKMAPKPPAPVYVAMESMTVNLQPDNGDRYLQIGIVLKSYDKEADGLIRMYMPELRSRVLLLLSAKTPAALYMADGKQALVQEILALTRQSYSSTVSDLKVKDVLFTNFVIQ